MKRLLLLFITASFTVNSFAQVQKSDVIYATKQTNALTNLKRLSQETGIKSYKETMPGDTVYMAHIASTDTITLYYSGTSNGFVHGMDSYGDKGFAERYDFSCADSTVKVIGVIARFGGTVTPNSSKSVIFHVWLPEAKSASIRPTLFNSGMPGSFIASKSYPFSVLGVSSVDTEMDAEKAFMFNAATELISTSFFVGYTVNYTWSNGMLDTIGLYSNKDGERTAPSYTVVSASDTTINNVSVTQYSDGSWHDNAVDNYEIRANLYIFPIVVVGPSVTAASSISRNGFSFYGTYPNPANNTTNVKIALAKSSDVTIQIMDMNGSTIRSIKTGILPAGENTLPVATTDLASGDYIFFVRTGDGNGIASKVSVVK